MTMSLIPTLAVSFSDIFYSIIKLDSRLFAERNFHRYWTIQDKSFISCLLPNMLRSLLMINDTSLQRFGEPYVGKNPTRKRISLEMESFDMKTFSEKFQYCEDLKQYKHYD